MKVNLKVVKLWILTFSDIENEMTKEKDIYRDIDINVVMPHNDNIN